MEKRDIKGGYAGLRYYSKTIFCGDTKKILTI
jgi:hypothetical protein